MFVKPRQENILISGAHKMDTIAMKYLAKRNIFTVVFCATLVFASENTLVYAQVLEQLDNGEIAPLTGGTYISEPVTQAPSTQSRGDDWLAQETANQATSASAVVFDTPAESAVATATQSILRSPKTSRLLSKEQQKMRVLTREVASSFSHHPAVIRAQLAPAKFIALFTAMIRQESNFNARAVSNKGAAGLGQLMPTTARDLGVCDVFSPSENLTASAVYLTNMLEQFGTPMMALAAYNAGPNAVAKYGDIPPYQETERYVADILLSAMRNVDEEGQKQPPKNSSFGYAAANPVTSISNIHHNIALDRKYVSNCEVASQQN